MISGTSGLEVVGFSAVDPWEVFDRWFDSEKIFMGPAVGFEGVPYAGELGLKLEDFDTSSSFCHDADG
jgi:hypothetical protein